MGLLNKAAVIVCAPILIGVIATKTEIGERALQKAKPLFAPITERLDGAINAGVKVAEQQTRALNAKNLVKSIEIDPMYIALKEVDPDTANMMLSKAKKASANGGNIDAAIASLQHDALEVARRYTSKASTDALMEMIREQIRLGTKAVEKDPLLCYGYFYPTNNSFENNNQFMTPADHESLAKTMANVIRSGAKNPTAISDPGGAQAGLNIVLKELSAKYGADLQLLSKPQAPDIDKGKLCVITLDFLYAVSNLSPEQAADVLRLTTGNTNSAQGPGASEPAPQPTPAPTLPPVSEEEIREADAELLKDPIFQAIAVADKDRYRALATEFAIGRKAGNTDAVINSGKTAGVELAQRLTPLAADQALINFSRASTDLAERVGAVDGPACLAVLNAQAVDPALNDQFKRESQRVKTTTAEAIKSGVLQPAPAPNAARAETLIKKVRERLPAEVSAVLAQGESADAAARCKAKVALYRQVFRLSRADAAIVLRTLFGKP